MNRVVARARVAVWVAIWVLIAVSLAAAQGVGAAITGKVTDDQGGVLPGVTIVARNADTGASRQAVSDGEGQYRIAGLPPGRYDVQGELAGFSPVVAKNLVLTTGFELRQDWKLSVAALAESVTVVGQAPVVDTTKSEVAGVVTKEQIASLPIEGRSAVTLALLMPGTGNDATRSRRPGANVGLGGVFTAGTNMLLDGLNNMISGVGDAREDVPQSAIQEFKVIVSQVPAEFGGRVGGVVSVVSKSGTNLFTGEAFEFFRHKNLNRMDRFQQQRHDQLGEPKPDFRRDQLGAAFGGPLIKDRLHFFGTFERTDLKEFFTVQTGHPELYASQEGTFEAGREANLYFVRADAQLSSRQNLFGRYSRQQSTQFCDGCGATRASFGTDVRVPGDAYFVGHTWVLSDRVLNEFAVLSARSYQFSDPSGRYTPAPFTPSVGSATYVLPSLRWGASPGTYFWNDYYQFRNALSVTAGRHAWKFGGGVQVLPTKQLRPGNPLGTWTFDTDQYFNPADPAFSFAQLTRPVQFQASFPAYLFKTVGHTYEAYIQDQWRVGSNLTLNLGLRYDLQKKVWNENLDMSHFPRPLPYVEFAGRGDNNNLAPRLGLAWDVFGNGRSVARGGYGIVYSNAQYTILDFELSNLQQYTVNIRNPQYPDPYQGRNPASFVSTAPPNISIGANDLVNAPSQNLSAGFSQVLSGDLAFHLDGTYSRIDDLPTDVPINAPDPVTGVRPLPEWGNITQRQRSQGTFEYRALLARLDKRFSRRHQYTVSYTLASQGDVRASTSTVTDARNLGLDAGPASNDRRHALVASGAVILPGDVTLGTVWTLRSSAPFSALAGRDLNGDGNNTDYVPGTTRNQGNRDLDLGLVNAWRAQNGLGPLAASQIDTNTYNRVDARVSKAFPFGGRRRLELIGQVFNLFGTDNLGGIGTTWVTNALSDSFGRLLQAQPRQQAELAVKLTF